MKTTHRTTNNESLILSENGVVSLFVTMVIMIILSVVVIGFSQISRRETRAALDRQLSTQSFYAAESGINDAYSIIRYNVVNGTAPPSNVGPTCTKAPYDVATNLNSATNTSYTCLLVNTTPNNLPFTINAGQSWVEDLIPSVAQTFKSITLNWQNDVAGQNTNDIVSGCSINNTSPNHLPPNNNWSSINPSQYTCPSIIEVDLVPVTTPISEANLKNNVRTFFLYPVKSGATTVHFDTVKSASINNAGCTSQPSSCTVVIDHLSASEYAIRLQYIYGTPPKVNLSAMGTLGQVSFKDAEAQIDATGKSQDVLRRIQGEVSLSPNTGVSVPNDAIQSNASLCKRLVVWTRTGNDSAWINIPQSYPSDLAPLSGPQSYDLNVPPPTFSVPSSLATNNSCDPYGP